MAGVPARQCRTRWTSTCWRPRHPRWNETINGRTSSRHGTTMTTIITTIIRTTPRAIGFLHWRSSHTRNPCHGPIRMKMKTRPSCALRSALVPTHPYPPRPPRPPFPTTPSPPPRTTPPSPPRLTRLVSDPTASMNTICPASGICPCITHLPSPRWSRRRMDRRRTAASRTRPVITAVLGSARS